MKIYLHDLRLKKNFLNQAQRTITIKEKLLDSTASNLRTYLHYEKKIRIILVEQASQGLTQEKGLVCGIKNSSYKSI